jgi:hypothetical protein
MSRSAARVRRSMKSAVVRCWCSATDRPVFAVMCGSHIQSRDAAHTRWPISSR